ncbi:MAG: response regulator transcription factor [Anaerolineales bacterium]|nr:response regulator transcription factor [Anaerolineales bacterium]
MPDDLIRVLIADDHLVVRKGLRDFLETYTDIQVVADAENGIQTVELAREYAPDVILMDLQMPKMDGIEAIEQIMVFSPATSIIVLTSYTEDEYLFSAMRAGARGYLLKNVEPEDLVNAIRAAIRGQATLHPSVAARLVQGIEHPGDDSLTNLTERELDVLRLIARGKSNKEISEELVVAAGTVKSHVSNILSKLHLAHRTQAALYALKRRLVPLEDSKDTEGRKIV